MTRGGRQIVATIAAASVGASVGRADEVIE